MLNTNFIDMSFQNWSPNYLSAIPYHLQLKNILQKAIDEGRLSESTLLPQPQVVGVKSFFQKNYAIKAYDLLVEEGKLNYLLESGYFLNNKKDKKP